MFNNCNIIPTFNKKKLPFCIYYFRLFQNPVGMSRAEVIERFNANVGYSGLIYSVSQDVSSFFNVLC